MAFDKDAFWKSLQAGVVPTRPPVPKAKAPEPIEPKPVLRITGKCILMVTRSQCSCGITYTSPNRLFVEYEGTGPIKTTQLKPLPAGQYPAGMIREIRQHEVKIDYCQTCFLTRGFEPTNSTEDRQFDPNVIDLQEFRAKS